MSARLPRPFGPTFHQRRFLSKVGPSAPFPRPWRLGRITQLRGHWAHWLSYEANLPLREHRGVGIDAPGSAGSRAGKHETARFPGTQLPIGFPSGGSGLAWLRCWGEMPCYPLWREQKTGAKGFHASLLPAAARIIQRASPPASAGRSSWGRGSVPRGQHGYSFSQHRASCLRPAPRRSATAPRCGRALWCRPTRAGGARGEGDEAPSAESAGMPRGVGGRALRRLRLGRHHPGAGRHQRLRGCVRPHLGAVAERRGVRVAGTRLRCCERGQFLRVGRAGPIRVPSWIGRHWPVAMPADDPSSCRQQARVQPFAACLLLSPQRVARHFAQHLSHASPLTHRLGSLWEAAYPEIGLFRASRP